MNVNTYMTPLEDGLLGHAKNRRHGRYRERPAFHDILNASGKEEEEGKIRGRSRRKEKRREDHYASRSSTMLTCLGTVACVRACVVLSP
jgi:hypothetical protein